ncbi:DUF4410 domain-containing protein [Lysobacter soli]|uniref:DUF4410 domain-containing protein n=1 Tax=Lysobacter soli TaxID=453783 RepID=UPI0037C5BA3E
MKGIRVTVATVALAALSACSTTSVMHSGYRVAEAQTFAYEITNTSEMSVAGLALLRDSLDAQLTDRRLLAVNGDPTALKVDVRINNYYMRNGAARFLVGIMAGRDSIRSTVKVVRADGQQMGHFEVDSYNGTALGTSSGLVEKHAKEIVDRIAALKSVATAAPTMGELPAQSQPSTGGMKWKPRGF